ENQQHVVLVAVLPQDRQILRRRVDDAAGMTDRFDDHRRHGVGVFHLDHVAQKGGARDLTRWVFLAEWAAVASRRKNVQEAGGEWFVHRLARFQARSRQGAERRAVPRQVTADDLVLARRSRELVILPGQLNRSLGHFRAAALEFYRGQVAGR